MVFSSFTFLVFFTIVCFLMLLTNLKGKTNQEKRLFIRHIILLIASYIFYGWWNWKCLFLMVGLTAISYGCSLMLEKPNKKFYLALGVIVPLVVLGVFKYFNFFVDSFSQMFGIQRMGTLNILLPVGISFYTFQTLSYTLDVWRGKVKPEKSFIKVALYIAFFPQLVAGPIVKAGEFLPQLYEDRNISAENFKKGIQFFVFGLFKKMVIADNISVCVDTVFQMPENFHAISILAAVIGYSIQIYCDFSGYSDMAIGCAKCLGYDLMRNFDMPYISKNISEFWKRWHISLSTWLQEYLYIPLGGNRRGTVRTYINLFLTMLIGGLWHGAAWTFVAWGALHGVALCIHKLWMKLLKRDKSYHGTALGNICSMVTTYIFVAFCWIFFRAGDFQTAWSVITGMFTWQKGIMYISSWVVIGVSCVAVSTAIACIKAVKRKEVSHGFYPLVSLDTIWGRVLLLVAAGITFSLAYTGSNPFIYFQF